MLVIPVVVLPVPLVPVFVPPLVAEVLAAALELVAPVAPALGLMLLLVLDVPTLPADDPGTERLLADDDG